jgi:hypothetical protein
MDITTTKLTDMPAASWPLGADSALGSAPQPAVAKHYEEWFSDRSKVLVGPEQPMQGLSRQAGLELMFKGLELQSQGAFLGGNQGGGAGQMDMLNQFMALNQSAKLEEVADGFRELTDVLRQCLVQKDDKTQTTIFHEMADHIRHMSQKVEALYTGRSAAAPGLTEDRETAV